MYIINLDLNSNKVREDIEVLDLLIKYSIVLLSNEDKGKFYFVMELFLNFQKYQNFGKESNFK